MIVLDTNVLSELARRVPDRAVLAWFEGRAAADLCLSAVTVAEMAYGVARLPSGRRRNEIAERVERVIVGFGGRVLPFGEEAGRAFGPIVAERDRAGRPVATADAQIAAICRVHDAALATRNVRDFLGTGVRVVDPWTAPIAGRS
ncbi:type II toxin-antitoxin system VapC family toxin [Isoptericola sp. NPDC019693]|uniref:type II toxin-antitoxin system VapC family toxin n=1 Tax=Isoptericola sp. NPDC019693 TaxID=3364009 RepID=UPI00378E263C